MNRILRQWIASLATLILPAAVSLALLRYRPLASFVGMSYVIAVAAAGWLGGFAASVVVTLACIPLATEIVTGGKLLLPAHPNPFQIATLLLVGLLSSAVARFRNRAEQMLRQSNLELEETVRERTAEVERARSWLEITLSSIGDGVIATDRAGSVTFLNTVAEKLTGWKQAEAEGKPIGEVFVVLDEATREPAANPIATALHSGETTGLGRNIVLLSRDGREFAIDDSAAPIRDAQQQVAGAVVTFRDVGERRRNERMAEQARLRLEQSNSELEQFAYAASHDLREPLRNISIYTQILAEQYRGRLDPEADRFVDFILCGTRRMEQMLKDLLAYTQDSAAVGLAARPTDANAALGNVIGSLKASIGECDARITSDALPVIPMDQVHLEQLLQNLIGNALKYRGQRKPDIHVGVSRDSSEWIFCVADSGIGIAPAYQERIFGLFKRLHSSEEYAGTGIGLALCRKIVQRYGGRIWVESEPGAGSRFYFTVQTEDSAAEPATRSS